MNYFSEDNALEAIRNLIIVSGNGYSRRARRNLCKKLQLKWKDYVEAEKIVFESEFKMIVKEKTKNEKVLKKYSNKESIGEIKLRNLGLVFFKAMKIENDLQVWYERLFIIVNNLHPKVLKEVLEIV